MVAASAGAVAAVTAATVNGSSLLNGEIVSAFLLLVSLAVCAALVGDLVSYFIKKVKTNKINKGGK